jgi:hypothetical protein
LAEQHPEEVARLAAALDAVLVEEQRGETSTTRAATEEEETGLEALGYGGAGD